MAEQVGALQQQMLMLQQQMQQMMALAQQAEATAHQSDDRAAHSEARLVQVDAQLAAAAAARPVDPPQPRSEIVDTRLLSKPKNFNGKLDEWIPWAFKIRAYLGALDGTLLEELDGVAAHSMGDVANSGLTTASAARRPGKSSC